MSVTPKSGKHGPGIANPDCTSTTSESPSPLAGGHKASFRSTKLARRARSFKEDFLEKISQMRSPPTNNSGGGGGGIIRPHSPRAALTRHGHVVANYSGEEKNPAREVELMVRQVQVALKHFRDVVTKDKLEMLPGNGTIVLDTVLAIVSSMRPLLGGEPQSSAALGSATHHVYQSLARLIKLCDDVLLNGRQSSALAPDNVTEIVTLLEDAVQELVLVAKDKLSQKQPSAMQVPGAAVVTAVATRLDLPAQRNSLPDIPLTPRERQNLEQKSGTKGTGNALGPGGAATVRSSHSTESVLRAESPTPPPKPPLPSGLLFSLCLPDAEVASLGTPPPLPPKKRSQRAHQLIGECCTSDSSLLGYSCDRGSFRSRSPEDSSSLLSASAGSLDSVLNHSREEDEIQVLMGHSHVDDVRRENDISDISYITNHNSNGSCFDESFQPLSTLNHCEIAPEMNRLSNTDSGFASIRSHRNSVHSFSTSKRSSQQSSSSQWSSSQQNSFKQVYTAETTSATSALTEIDGTDMIEQQFSLSQIEKSALSTTTTTSAIATTSTSTTTFSQHSSLSSSQMSDLSVVQPIVGEDNVDFTTDEIIPPAIPQKTRSRRGRHERQPSPYDNVPLDNMAGEFIPCLMHQSQTNTVSNLTDTENAKPPPLPVKKRHIMAYMEMFGNCSHSNDNEFMRHSMHMVQAQWQNQHQQSLDSGLSTTQSCSFVHTTTSTHHHHQHQHEHEHHTTTLTPPPTMMSSTPVTLDNRLSSPGQVSPARSVSPIIYTTTTGSNSVPPALPPKRSRAASTKSNASSPPPPARLHIPVTVSDKSPETAESESNHIDDNYITICNANKLSPKMNRESVERTSPLSASTPTPTLTPTPINSQKLSPGDLSAKSTDTAESILNNDVDLIEELDIGKYIVLKKSDEDGPEIRGGYIDALIVQATNTNIKVDFSYQEAFLTTYRTFISPNDLVTKLIRRHQHFNCQPDRKARAREAFSLLVRVVKDLTVSDLENSLVQMVMEFICQLVCSGSLTQAKLLRVTLIEKYNAKILQNKMLNQQATLTLVAASATLLEFKSEQIAEQMTLLDADLFMKIEIPEVLIWAQEQNEERSPNLTRFTEHFNKMSYWARTKILQSEAKDREKYVMKFIKIMKHLRKINNFNSYLALLSALDSAPIRRLEWQKHITEGLKEYCALIDSSSSFRAYRQALAETSPPCIPYIGLVLQDLTFVHIGNSNLLPDGTINFSKRWQQFNIVENMKRFKKCTYTFKKNERIIAFFRNFDDFIGEDAMWQISESIKPRGGKKPA